MKYLSLISLFLLNGCIQLLPDPKPPAQKIWLNLDNKPLGAFKSSLGESSLSGSSLNESDRGALNKQKKGSQVRLLIERPSLTVGLDSTKIRVINKGQGISTVTHLENLEWPQLLGDLLEQNLTNYFTAGHQFHSVLPLSLVSNDTHFGTHQLRLVVTRCELNLIQTPQFFFQGQLSLINTITHKVVAQQAINYQPQWARIDRASISTVLTTTFNQLNTDCNLFLRSYFN